MELKIFLISDINKIKNVPIKEKKYYIDINSWFKTNKITPLLINDIQEYIFEIWLRKKIIKYKSKISLTKSLIIIYNKYNPSFINFLKEIISNIFPQYKQEIIIIKKITN